MTMNFRTIKAAIQTVLSNYASTGNYRVVGYDDDKIGADYLKGSYRLVEVYNTEGTFPRNRSGFGGSVMHEVTTAIDLTVSAQAQLDLSVIDDPSASAAAVAAALTASQKAIGVADTAMDEFIDTVYQLLMDNRNRTMGLATGTIADRWVATWRKSKPMTRGSMAVCNATMDLTYSANEDILGTTPVAATAGEALRGTIETTTNEDDPLLGGAGVLAGG